MMKLYHYFTLLVAVTISVCAAYYSIVGLAAIFAAAALPVIIMGAVLELAKITGAVWLKLYWNQASWWIKIYLVPAVAILMIITSIGIFGFLSKAHIEQTASAQEGIAQIERIEAEIARQQEIIATAQQRIESARNEGNNQDSQIQQQIDTEQARIDTAYQRIQPAIDEQLAIISRAESDIETRIATFREQLTALDTVLENLSSALAANDVRTAQGIVGVRQDGSLGPATQNAIQTFRDSQESRRNELLARIEEIRTAPNDVVDRARNEISRLRGLAEEQIAQSNELINRLRAQLGTVDTARVQETVDEQQARIAEANNTIDELVDQKFKLEAERRALEAEVGPIKYVAEMIYGADAGSDLLEQSVRWMILLLVAVFDPLAVILTIAAISGIANFGQTQKKRVNKEFNENFVINQPVLEYYTTVEKPMALHTIEVPTEVEKIVEVPVETIREVEKIVEVPVETIREVEKIVEVSIEDLEKTKELAQEVENLLDTVEKQKNIIKKLKQEQKVRNQPIAEPDFDLGDVSGASFGATWPNNPVKGQLFLKVDTLPNKLYKWNGRKWIEIDIARIEDTLAYDEKYIKFLVKEIKQGRREYEDLSDIEQNQIKSYIRSHGNNEDIK